VIGKFPVFIFIHGGGWVLGDYPTHWRMVRDLVVRLVTPQCLSITLGRPTPNQRNPESVGCIAIPTMHLRSIE